MIHRRQLVGLCGVTALSGLGACLGSDSGDDSVPVTERQTGPHITVPQDQISQSKLQNADVHQFEDLSQALRPKVKEAIENPGTEIPLENATVPDHNFVVSYEGTLYHIKRS